MDTTAPTAREQFVNDYTLITDNDRTAYEAMQALMNQNGGHNVSWLSEYLREAFENRISEVIERERRRGNGYTADLIGQMLIGYGSAPFDDIARHYIDTDLETRLIKRLESVLKTQKAGA
jgi:hypothetical protein